MEELQINKILVHQLTSFVKSTKGNEGTFRKDRYVLYTHYGNGYTGVHICQK